MLLARLWTIVGVGLCLKKRREATLALSANTSPLGDSQAASRAGKLHVVGLSSEWGSKPYPISQSGSAPYSSEMTRDSGEIYTDESEQGWHIRKVLLDMHNYVRKLEVPATKYLTKLVWDFHLEAYSRQWAQALCENSDSNYFEHSPNSATGIPAWPFRIATGENLYTSSAVRPKTDDFGDVVTKWYAEREDFDWSTGNSKNSKPVGHWKQLVRPQMTAVGCTVISNCHANSSGWKTFVVCHYDYGNIGTLPYDSGTGEDAVCKNCPAGFTCCESGLCSGRVPDSSTSLAPYAQTESSTDDWYGCATHLRSNCDSTGAVSFIGETVSGDTSNLEFQQCLCGGTSPTDFNYIVEHGFFYFRNSCFQLTNADATADDEVNNIYAMAQVRSKRKDNIYVDDDSQSNVLTSADKGPDADPRRPSSSKWGFTRQFRDSIKPLSVKLDAGAVDVDSSPKDAFNYSSDTEGVPFFMHLQKQDKEDLKGLALPPTAKSKPALKSTNRAQPPPAASVNKLKNEKIKKISLPEMNVDP